MQRISSAHVSIGAQAAFASSSPSEPKLGSRFSLTSPEGRTQGTCLLVASKDHEPEFNVKLSFSAVVSRGCFLSVAAYSRTWGMNRCDYSFDSTCSTHFALPLACHRRAALNYVQESTQLRAHHLGKIACGSLRDGNALLCLCGCQNPSLCLLSFCLYEC